MFNFLFSFRSDRHIRGDYVNLTALDRRDEICEDHRLVLDGNTDLLAYCACQIDSHARQLVLIVENPRLRVLPRCLKRLLSPPEGIESFVPSRLAALVK
jgi:hypothetical protein